MGEKFINTLPGFKGSEAGRSVVTSIIQPVCGMWMTKQLNNIKCGCMIGDRIVNHLRYADDLVIMSPSSAGLQQLPGISDKFGVMHDMVFNCTKTVIMIVRSEEGWMSEFSLFELAGKSPVKEFKYFGHVISNSLCDDDDIQRQCHRLYGQANMIAWKFSKCTKT